MPNATVDPNSFERVDLESLEGAYVMVRPLPYGKVLNRRDKATKMYMEANPGRSKDDVNRFELETLNEWAFIFDINYCIGEHNLEDVNGVQLDMSSPNGTAMVLQILDPRVGSEIEKILGKINGTESEEELEDFIKRHTSSSAAEETGSKTHLSSTT